MKNYLMSLFLMLFVSVFSQNLTFEMMQGVGQFFEIQNEKLVLNAPAETAKRQWIYPFSSTHQIQWESTIELNFEPSTSNYLDYYLISSTENLLEGSGYFIHWGMTGSEDVLQFFRQENGQKTQISEGKTLIGLGGQIQLKITRNEYGLWKIYLNNQLEMQCFDNQLIENKYIGFLCSHTSTRSKNFSFDDVYMANFDDENLAKQNLHDLVFSEILIDEEPSNFLPKSEFIELYNRTNQAIQLKNWLLIVDNQSFVLDSFELLPQQYLILFPQKNDSLFSKENFKLACENWSLNNKKGQILLKSEGGKTIDLLNYDEKMVNQDAKKSGGGWSLERKDLDFFCDENQNWFYSTNLKGGTPSFQNSIDGKIIDEKAPILQTVFIENQQDIILTFDEKIEKITYQNELIDTFFKQNEVVKLHLKDSLKAEYEIKIQVNDCIGNVSERKIIVGQVQKTLKNDVFISEILPNPFENGTEFVEIYNKSEKIIDLSELWIGTLDEEGLWKSKVQLPKTLFYPNTYLVFSTKKESVLEFYEVNFPEQIFQIQLPILTNESGTIVLTNSNGEFLEEFSYSEKQHYHFLKDTKGVSLERISFEIATNDFENWTSSSKSATPTQSNSQEIAQKLMNFQLTSNIITPDGDGIDDRLQVQYAFEEENWMGTFMIFNRNGFKMTTFEKHKYLGKNGFVHWDITNENVHLFSVGFYVLIVELYNDKGDVKLVKLPFSIGN